MRKRLLLCYILNLRSIHYQGKTLIVQMNQFSFNYLVLESQRERRKSRWIFIFIIIGICIVLVGAGAPFLESGQRCTKPTTGTRSTSDECKFVCKCPPPSGTEDMVRKCGCPECSDPFAWFLYIQTILQCHQHLIHMSTTYFWFSEINICPDEHIPHTFIHLKFLQKSNLNEKHSHNFVIFRINFLLFRMILKRVFIKRTDYCKRKWLHNVIY